jgi:hypothetical protein
MVRVAMDWVPKRAVYEPRRGKLTGRITVHIQNTSAERAACLRHLGPLSVRVETLGGALAYRALEACEALLENELGIRVVAPPLGKVDVQIDAPGGVLYVGSGEETFPSDLVVNFLFTSSEETRLVGLAPRAGGEIDIGGLDDSCAGWLDANWTPPAVRVSEHARVRVPR